MIGPLPPIDSPPLTRGDAVTLSTDTGRDVLAVVRLASPNGRSLVLLFDAMVGGWLRQMPVFQADDGTWSALDGMPVTFTRCGFTCTLPPDDAFEENDALYTVAREVCHAHGLPWTDPRTGQTFPPKRNNNSE